MFGNRAAFFRGDVPRLRERVCAVTDSLHGGQGPTPWWPPPPDAEQTGPDEEETLGNPERLAMPEGGLEPPRVLPRWILNPLRLPIPPLRQGRNPSSASDDP